MKKKMSLSDLIKQANKSNPDHSLGEVTKLLDSGKKSAMQNKHSYQPRGINKLFKPLNLIVMTLIISILTTVLLISPWSNKASEGVLSKEELRVAGYELQGKEEPKVIAYLGSNLQNSVIDSSEKSKTIKSSSLELSDDNSFTTEENHLAKKDSIITGRIFVVDTAGMGRFGFKFDDEGYYYLNRLPDGSLLNFWSSKRKSGGGEFGFGKGAWVNQFNKQTETNLDFYPVVISDVTGKIKGQILQKKPITKKQFEEINDDLLPMLFRYTEFGGFLTEDIIVWFKLSDSFFKAFEGSDSQTDNELESGAVKIVLKQFGHIEYHYEDLTIPVNTIKLSKETIECLGFTFSKENVKYQYEYQGEMLQYRLDSNGGVASGLYSIDMMDRLIDSAHLVNAPPMLFAITNSKRNMIVGFESIKDKSRIKPSNPIVLDLCVPVQMDYGSETIPIEDFVFWFYPNEHFFECLPDSIAVPMRHEFNFHLKESGFVDEVIIEDFVADKEKKIEEVPCEFFPSFCEGLPGLEELLVYPNPASEIVNVEVILSRGKSIDYRIFDLSGRLLLDDLPTKTYSSEGRFKEEMDVSILPPGFYLLVLTDDEGARMTKRLVKN